MSNTNWGFLITFTQKRRGRLREERNSSQHPNQALRGSQHTPEFVEKELPTAQDLLFPSPRDANNPGQISIRLCPSAIPRPLPIPARPQLSMEKFLSIVNISKGKPGHQGAAVDPRIHSHRAAMAEPVGHHAWFPPFTSITLPEAPWGNPSISPAEGGTNGLPEGLISRLNTRGQSRQPQMLETHL